jgi:hypothetical protein
MMPYIAISNLKHVILFYSKTNAWHGILLSPPGLLRTPGLLYVTLSGLICQGQLYLSVLNQAPCCLVSLAASIYP